MKLAAGIWSTLLVLSCVFVYLIGAVGEVRDGWREAARRRQ